LNTFSGARPEEKTVVIRASIDGEANFDAVGREFEDMQLGLTSDSGAYGQAELIPLLVSGVPPGQGTDFTAFESGAQVPILVTEMSNLLTGTLLGAFVDDVSLGLRVEGGVDWGLKKSLGESLVFEVRGTQDATGQRVTPTFELKLSDRLSLEGSLRYFQDGTEGGDQIYETKLRYRIPLD